MAVLTCYLCEQPVVTPVPGDDHIFCCHGCRELWRILGDEEIAELKSRPGLNWQNLRNSLSPESPKLSMTADPRTVTLDIDGMWCASCSILVEHVLTQLPGVVAAQIDFATSTAQVAVDAATTTPAELTQTITDLGYGAKEHNVEDIDGTDRDLSLLRRFGVSAVLAIFVMMFSVPVWSGYLPHLPGGLKDVLAYGLWALATPVVFWGGWPFLRGAWSSLRHGVPTMDLLIAIGALSAYGYSAYTAVFGGRYLYFDTSTMLISFLLLSRNLEVGTRNRAAGVVRMLSQLSVKEATIWEDGRERKIPAEQLMIGQNVVIRPGERIPVDGIIVAGDSSLDESFLTGESLPADKGAGDMVYAGTINHSGRIVAEVRRVAADTILAQTARFVRAAQGAQGQWRRLADRVLRIFVPFVLVVGVITFVSWFVWGESMSHSYPTTLSTALLRTIAVFVIACPCALSVATPLAVLAGAQRLGRYGMLLRSDDALERSARIDTVLLDKTGTLTLGQMAVAEMCPRSIDLIQLAASVELASEHPIAQALVRWSEAQQIPLLTVENFQSLPGFGVQGVVNNHRVSVIALRSNDAIPDSLKNDADRLIGSDRTVAQIVIDNVTQGIIAFSDQIRPEAKQAIAALRDHGFAVWMITGDNHGTAQMVAEHLGIDHWESQKSPVDKASIVEHLQQAGHHVAFVGDGVNDAPALVQADLGIAMGTGSDIAVEAGHLTLTRPNVINLADTLTTGRHVAEIIKQNLWWALLYNLVALPAAAFGLAYPFVAALAMLLSSAFVLGNSLRILGFSPTRYVKGVAMVVSTIGALAVLAYLGL
ncbi:MAG: cadmium-translocating P-type ATPase [Firmicutes bacterium]|nr:cadmium-translocating P-type ATPase [Bacillota bacterium]